MMFKDVFNLVFPNNNMIRITHLSAIFPVGNNTGEPVPEFFILDFIGRWWWW